MKFFHLKNYYLLKYFLVIVFSAVLVLTLEVQPECINNKCDFDYQPHCACKTLQPKPWLKPGPIGTKKPSKTTDDCVQFTNECFFKEYNCSSKVFVSIKPEECSEEAEAIPIAVRCWKKCWHIYYPICACKNFEQPDVKNCRTFNHPCYFNMFNCTSKDYVRLHYGRCPETSMDGPSDLLSYNFNF